ncbi:hypothetical protein BB561_004932 [Smittium simulii]|uniref:DNA-directed RNA polymerase n=1 Tax=Smittium simulii TaxID=133385 RepID=A0A2T9YD89_9FUNG|nr:hypothetical protein BB561_004932 [Smittium simulii]
MFLTHTNKKLALRPLKNFHSLENLKYINTTNTILSKNIRTLSLVTTIPKCNPSSLRLYTITRPLHSSNNFKMEPKILSLKPDVNIGNEPSDFVEIKKHNLVDNVAQKDIFSSSFASDFTEDSLKDFELEQTIKDQISLLLACLYSGNIERGRRMILGLYKLYPTIMSKYADISIHNTIIKSFLDAKPVRVKDALGWYGKIQRDYKITPNIDTFAILINGYFKCGLDNLSLLIIQEFEKLGNKLESLVLSSYITDEDLIKIQTITNSRFKNKLEYLKTDVSTLLGNYSSDSMIHGDKKLSNDLATNDNSSKDLSQDLESEPQKKFDTQKIGSFMLSKLSSNDKNTKTTNTNTDKNINKSTSMPESQSEKIFENIPTPISVKKNDKEIIGVTLLKKVLNPLTMNDISDYKKQIMMESQAFESADFKLKMDSKNYDEGIFNTHMHKIKKYLTEWLPKLTLLIEDEIKKCNEITGITKDRKLYGPFLNLLPPEKIAATTVIEVLRQILTRFIRGERDKGPMNSVIAANTVSSISKALEAEYHHSMLKKKENSYLLARDVEIQKMSTSGKLFNLTFRNAQAKLERNLESSNWATEWPIVSSIKLGSLLLAMVIEVAKMEIDVIDPITKNNTKSMKSVLKHGYWISKGYRYGIVSVSDEFSSLLSSDDSVSLLNARMLPMIIPPKPWLNYESGGYITYRTKCMRIRSNKEQLHFLIHSAEQDKLATILSGLDVLGLTKWAVNERVLGTAVEIWNKKINLAGIPGLKLNLVEPEKPADFKTNPKSYYEWNNQVKSIKTQNANNHSSRCDVNYKIAIARAFVGKSLYFPHDIDFRGRAYPIPPHFNNLGDDLCRGLLRFYEGKPLGQRGEHWLRIHLANCYGYDKFSHDERIQFTHDNWKNIVDSAKNPLTGDRWWIKAEDPWQTLASSFELVDAIESGDPASYVSTIHVHQDGTCNGLQHYAALGRDLEGAKQVNLVYSDRPQDVYTAILNIVNSEVENDYKDGVREATLLRGHLKRKVIKQTVMTNVYGVTLIGAKLQIISRLKEVVDPVTEECIFDDADLRILSVYLAKKVFLSLGVMFESARKIQDWLNEAAKRISKSLPENSFNVKKKIAQIKKKATHATSALKKAKTADKAKKDLIDKTNSKDLNAETSSIEKELEPNTKDQDDTSLNADIAKRDIEGDGNAVEDIKPIPDQNSEKTIKTPTKLRPKNTINYRKNKMIDELLAKPMSSVVWTTPLGLTVVQPYRKNAVRNIKTSLQQLAVLDYNIPSPVNTFKQKTAFPPNFIHSLDASHMLLSAIACKKKNLTFSSVHDSYWTHACDVDVMNDTLREEFVNLHSTDILKSLKTEFELRYGNNLIPVINLPQANSDKTKSSDLSDNNKSEELSDVTEDLSNTTDKSLPDHLKEVFDESTSEGIEESSFDERHGGIPVPLNKLESENIDGDSSKTLETTKKSLKEESSFDERHGGIPVPLNKLESENIDGDSSKTLETTKKSLKANYFLRNKSIPTAIKFKVLLLALILIGTYGGELFGMSEQRNSLIKKVSDQVLRLIPGVGKNTVLNILRAEYGINTINSKTSCLRERAYIKLPILRTWIADLTKNPIKAGASILVSEKTR